MRKLVFTVEPKVAKKRIQKDIDNKIDRASSVHFVDEYHKYFLETMELINQGKVLFKEIMQ